MAPLEIRRTLSLEPLVRLACSFQEVVRRELGVVRREARVARQIIRVVFCSTALGSRSTAWLLHSSTWKKRTEAGPCERCAAHFKFRGGPPYCRDRRRGHPRLADSQAASSVARDISRSEASRASYASRGIGMPRADGGSKVWIGPREAVTRTTEHAAPRPSSLLSLFTRAQEVRSSEKI